MSSAAGCPKNAFSRASQGVPPVLPATSRATVGCGREGTGNAPAQTVARASELLRCRNVGCGKARAKLAGAFPAPSRSTCRRAIWSEGVRLGLSVNQQQQG